MTNNAFNSNIPVEIAKGGTNATSLATTDGTLYYDGTRVVTTAIGTPGVVLTSSGSGSAPSYVKPAMKLVQTQTANNSASLTFKDLFSTTVLGLSHVHYLVITDVQPVTAGAFLIMQMSQDNGSTFINTGYQSGVLLVSYNSSTFINTNDTAAWDLGVGIGNGSATDTYNSYLYISGTNIGNFPHVYGQGSQLANSTGLLTQTIFGGVGGNTGMNAFRVLMNSGNISKGTFSLYSMIP